MARSGLARVDRLSTTGAGSITGSRFSVTGSSLVTGTGNNLTFLPGSTAGTLDYNGQIDNLIGPIFSDLVARPVPSDTDMFAFGGAADNNERRRILWSEFKAAMAAQIGAVSYSAAQALTTAQQDRARANIDAGVLAGFRNKLTNPSFLIAQRAISGSIPASNVGWVSDRWRITNQTNQTLNWSLTGPYGTSMTGLPRGVHTWLYLTFSVAPTSGYIGLYQTIEDAATLAGGDVTLTCYSYFPDASTLTYGWSRVFGSGGSTETGAQGTPTTPGAAQPVEPLLGKARAAVRHRQDLRRGS